MNLKPSPRLKLKARTKYLKLRHRASIASPILNGAISRIPRLSKKTIGAVFTLLVTLGVVASLIVGGSSPATAVTLNLTSTDLLGGSSQYGNISLSNSQISLQNGVVGQWSNPNQTPVLPGLSYGTPNLAYGPNDTLYWLTNVSGDCHFARLDMDRQTWDSNLRTPPVGCGTGNTLSFDGVGSMYYTPGGPSPRLFRYDIGANSWTELASLSTNIGDLSAAQFVTSGSNHYLYVFRGLSSASLWRYNVDTNIWESMAPFPTTTNVNNGIQMTYDGAGNIYALSNDQGEFKRYSVATNTWTSLTNLSNACYRSGLQYAAGKVFNVRLQWCTDVSTMNSYDVASGTWTNRAAPPVAGNQHDFPPPTAYDGSRYMYTAMGAELRPQLARFDTVSLTWDSASLFALGTDDSAYHWKVIGDGSTNAYWMGGKTTSSYDRVYKFDATTQTSTRVGSQINTTSGYTGTYSGGSLYTVPSPGTTTFQKYNTSTNTFSTLSDLPFVSAVGSDLVDGGNGYIYSIFGGRNNFQRYNISTNTWSALSTLPQSPGAGSGITRIGTNIYVLNGAQTGYLFKYDITAGTWATLSSGSEGSVDYGGFLTGDGTRYLYAGMSSRSQATARIIVRFDTTTNTWQRIADAPQQLEPYASAFYDTSNNKLYVAQGEAGPGIWSWTPGTTANVTSGNWYSKTYDLKQVQSWTSLSATTSGTGTSTIYTRTSPDGNVWTNWQGVSGTTINSPVNRYIQVKVTLTGNGTNNSIVSNIAISHTQESAAPSLPAQFNAFGNNGGTALASGQPYEYRHPYFSWTAADDGVNGSGVAGYYVYFGTDSSADPQTAGSFQTGLDYTGSTPFTAGDIDYLRIEVKDNLGNVSPAATFFSYRYEYVSPPGNITETSTSDFAGGQNTNVAISNGSMSLTQKPDGAWTTGEASMLPENVRGPAEVVIGNYMYVARGAATTTFWRYDLTTQTWDTMASTPDTVNIGSSIAYDGGNFLYLLRGGTTSSFYKYNIQNDTWSTLVNVPSNVQQGSDIKFIGNNTFAVMLTGVREFYFFDATTNTFTSRSAYPTTITDAGSGLWYDGADTIYAYLGGYNWYSERTHFGLVKYSISADTWRNLAASPVTATYDQNNLVSDGRGNLYIFTNNNSDNTNRNQRAMKYNIASDKWDEIPGYGSNMTWGSMTSDGSRYIYLLPSEDTNTRKMVRYDTVSGIFAPGNPGANTMDRVPWDSHTNAWPWLNGNASASAYDGSKYIYAIGGAESTWSRFMKFDPVSGDTRYLPPPPYIGVGDSLTYMNGNVYFAPARSLKEFYKFDEPNRQWIRMADMPGVMYRPGPSTLQNYGGVIYAAAGNGTAFYKFTPDAGAGVWTTMTAAPGTILNGSAVVDASNGVIYYAGANNASKFYRYNIAANNWTTLADLPGSSQYGSTMVINNGKLYLMRGNYTKTDYVYDISSGSWSTGTDAPEQFRYGATWVNMGSYAMAIAGENSPDFWRFNFPGANTGYNGLAVHISQPSATAGLFDWASVTAQGTIPANTHVELYTRTSDDGNTWSDWAISADQKNSSTGVTGNIASAVKKFIQFKVVLSSDDNVSTPVVDSVSVNYYYDTDPPQNPTTLDAYSDNTRATPLQNSVWYNYANPQFDWPDSGQSGGATDGAVGSRIAGYWVYVGTDFTASPRTAGTFVPVSEYVPNLVSPGTYYVRIQAQDYAGNIDPTVFAPFSYKFDNQYPTNPAFISVNPSGYTSHNNFSFTWPGAFDNDSGVAGYCYHTGATSGAFAVETCQAGTDLSNISAAYNNGTNVLYLRAYDNAGNYAPSYTSVSYYYSTNPPGPVTNLRAVPPSSPQNLFTFIWDLPTTFAGDPARLGYCYSVNQLPTALNTTCTNDKFIPAFKAATQQGTNIIYMVARDEAGIADWTTFATANFIANTVSPGIPLNLVVSDTSDRATKRWSLTETWDPPTFAGNGVTEYKVERSDDAVHFTQIGSTSARAYVDLDVQPNQTYYYRVRAADNVDNEGGPSGYVSKEAKGAYTDPPALVVEPEAKPGSDEATITWATERPSTSFVYYGATPNDLSQSKGGLDLAGVHNIVINGLQPNTTYYYRVQSFDNDRSYTLENSYSKIYNFTTTAAASIYNVRSSNVTMSSAVLSWKTSVPTKTRIEYGPSMSYALSSSDGDAMAANHTVKLDGLNAGTTYHYRLVASTEAGGTLYSDDYAFTTIARPTISRIQFQGLDDQASSGVEVVWLTNVPTSSTVKYTALGQDSEITKSELTTSHSVVIHGLASASDYTFTIEGRDQYGNLASSSPQVWRSSVDTRPAVISNISISVTTTQGNGAPKGQMIVVWNTDEPATTQVNYGRYDTGKMDKWTPLDTEPTTNHVAVISDLNLSDIYQVQFSSKDLSGNEAYSAKTLVVTPDKEQSLLDSTLDLLLRVFRF